MKFLITKFSALEPIVEYEAGHWQALKALGLGNYIDLLLFSIASVQLDHWTYIYAERIKY